MTSDQIVKLVNIGLIVIFVLVLVGLLIAAIKGFKKGIFKSTYKMLFFFVLFAALLICLTPLSEVIGKIDLTWLPIKSVKITVTQTGEVWYAPVSTLFGTIRDSFEVAYQAFNPGASSAKAAEFGVAIATSLTKYVTLFAFTLIFITVGTLIAVLLWNIAFKRVVPKLARRIVRVPWASLGINIVTYVVCAFLFVAPLSAMVNTVGNAAKKASVNTENNETVKLVNDIVDTYNNSLIANVFFNWTADESGLTIDERYVGTATSTVVDDTTINLIYEINNLADLAAYMLEGVTFGEDGIAIDYSFAFTVETIEQIFKTLKNSQLIMYSLPIAADLAFNSTLLSEYVDASLLDYNNLGVDWDKELDNLETICKDVARSGVLNTFINDDGDLVAPNDFTSIITALLDEEARDDYEDLFNTIDNSKLLSRLLPAVLDSVSSDLSQDPNAGSYVENLTFENLANIKWGEELNVVYSSICQLYDVDPRIVNVITDLTTTPSQEPQSVLNKKYRGLVKNEAQTYTLMDLLTANFSSYSDILFGIYRNDTLDTSILDDNGKTIVYDEHGEKIENRNYCLFDSELIHLMSGPLLGALQSSINSISEDPSDINITDQMVEDALTELNADTWRVNYKIEFNAIADTFEALLNNSEIQTCLKNGMDFSTLVPGGDITAINDSVVTDLRKALPRMDNSILCNYFLVPTLHDVIFTDDTKSTFEGFGLDADVIEEGYKHAADIHYVGHELANLLGYLDDLGVLTNALSKGTTAEIVDELSSHSLNVARLLDAIYSSNLINYNGTKGANYNYFSLIDFTLSGNMPSGIEFKDEVKNDSTVVWANTWNADQTEIVTYGENGRFADVIKIIGEKDFIDIADAIQTESDVIGYLADEESANAPIKTLLTAIDDSKIFSATIGDFLDNSLSSSGLLGAGVSFTNVENWKKEGNTLHNVLLSLDKLSLNLNNISLTDVTDVVSLNDLLHSLADSGIFDYYNTSLGQEQYLFGTWLFNKVSSSLKVGSFDLLADPVDPNLSLHPTQTRYWNAGWGEDTASDYTIAEIDFKSLTKDDWCSESYEYGAFDTSSYGNQYWNNAQFEADYFGNDLDMKIRTDEISKLTYVIYNLSCKIGDLNNIMTSSIVTTDAIGSLLYSINDTNILRMCVYNLYDYIKQEVADNADVGNYIRLETAYLPYLIDTGTGSLTITDESRNSRKTELTYLIKLFDALKEFQNTEGLFDGGSIQMNKMTSTLLAKLKLALRGFNESNVFHRQGSILTNLDGADSSWNPTVFQNTVYSILNGEDFVDLLFNKNNPKDVYFGNTLNNYSFDNSTSNKDAAMRKVKWMINDKFSSSSTADFDYELTQIDNFIEILISIIGGPTSDNPNVSYKGLHKDNSELTFNVSLVDFTNNDNVIGLESVLNALLDSDLLCDAVPNAVDMCLSNAFSGVSSTYLDLSDANVFCPYFKSATGQNVPSNVSQVPTSNWNNKFSSEDVTCLINILTESSTNPDLMNALSDLTSITPAQKGAVNAFIDEIQASNIFHRSGSKYIAGLDGSLSLAKAHGLTVFQELSCEIFAGDMLSSYFFDKSNVDSKDYAANSLGLYNNASSKAIRYAKLFFSSNGSNPTDITINSSFDNASLSLDEQVTEIGKILDLLDYSSTINDIKVNGIDSLDVAILENLLDDINDTKTLYDIVPNVINKSLNNDLSVSGVNLGDGDYYYHYTYNLTDPSYTVKYDEDEISTICTILSDYQTLINDFDFNNIDLGDVTSLQDSLLDYLSANVLPDIHSSKAMHIANKYLETTINVATNDTKLTVFEQFMYMVVNESGLSDYSYNAEVDTLYSSASIKTISRIKNLSAYEANSSLEGFDGFARYYDNGEIKYLFDFIKVIKQDMINSGASSFNDLSLTDLSPEQCDELMTALNKVYITHGALATFIDDTYDSIGINDYASYTYNATTTKHAKYNFTQAKYEDEEIGYLVTLLDGIATRDGSNNFTGYENFDDISSSIALSYVDKSDIFSETFETGEHSYVVSTKGLFIYNIFDGQNLLQYVTGNNDEKLKVLDIIFSLDEFNAENEGSALDGISSHMNALNAIDLSDFADLANSIDDINAVFKFAYDAKNDNSNLRSYLVSEIISNILNESLEEQYTELDVKALDYERCDFGISSFEDISATCYDNINSIENNGLKGVVSLANIISKYNLVSNTIDTTSTDVKNAYKLMGDNVLGNSSLAKIYYLNKAHESITGVTQQYINIRLVNSWNDLPSDVFDENFHFEANGISLSNFFLSEGMIAS